MGDKVKSQNVTEEQKERMRNCVHNAVKSCSEPEDLNTASRVLHSLVAGRGKDISSLVSSLGSSLVSSLYSSLVSSLVSSLDSSLGSSLDSSLVSSLYSSLDSSLVSSLGSSLDSSLGSSLDSSLGSSLGSSLYSSLDSSLGSSLGSSYCGIWWIWWLVRYQQGAVLGVEYERNKLELLTLYCAHCPMVGVRDGEIFVYHKPKNISWVVTGETGDEWRFPIYELHSEGKPTVTMRDDKTHMYFWHNLKIPERMGEKFSKDWNPKWVLDEPNSEVRRLLLEQLGAEKVLESCEGKELSRWKDYKLYQIPTPDDEDEDIHLLKMVCPSTGHVFVEGIPPSIHDAEEAKAWQLGFSKEELNKFNTVWEA